MFSWAFAAYSDDTVTQNISAAENDEIVFISVPG
jgi:hypothetical protein